MKTFPQIRFIGVAASAALDAAARQRIAKLEQRHPDMLSCHVAITQEGRHHQQGRLFAVRVDATAPGHEFAADRMHDEDPYVALQDAFDAVQRQMQVAAERARAGGYAKAA